MLIGVAMHLMKMKLFWTKTTAKKNDREATVWIEGLDRINKVRGGRVNGIRLCIDFSATPFYIQGSGNEVGRPFPLGSV